MNTVRQALGVWGEEAAARYLTQKGFRLLARNWRKGHWEIDIIAEWFGELVFVEVKSRQTEAVTTALEAVDRSKQQHVIAAAHAYMAYYLLDQPYRFDIITLVGTPAAFELRHYPNAFTPQSAAARY